MVLDKIINTNKDKCTGCNKCIMICPVKFANNVELTDNERKIEIDEYRCIACGKCLKVCDHNARKYIDDLDKFLNDLKNGEKVSLIVAPSFMPNQPSIYKRVFGYFKSLGINLIYDVSLGADITSWGYVKYFSKNKPKDFTISQPCPTIVNYIERYTPNLIANLIPIQSPVMCTAIYLRKYQNVTDKIALISPCIAKKSEIEKESNLGLVDYNITFDNLFAYFNENNIDLMSFPEVDFDNDKCGLGMKLSKVGGLNENLLYHLPELKIRLLDGPEKVFDYLNFLDKGFRCGEYDLLDILNCNNGCNVGTASCKESYDHEISKEIEDEILGYKRLKVQDEIEIDYDEYNKRLKYFDDNLNLNDFHVEYTDKSDKITFIHPNEDEFENAYIKLKKYDESSRTINCYSCGYKTCKDMAIAIHNNYNTPLSCHQYNRKELETQKDISDYVRTILAYLTKAIIVTDENGFIKFINQETQRLLGFSSDEFINKHIQNLFHNINLDEITEASSKMYECQRKSGNACHLRVENRLFERKNRKFLLFVLEDVTKQIEMDNLKSNFISTISHELRTPLTSIKGALGLLSSGILGDLSEKSKDLLNIANNNVVRLVNLINEILDLEKITAGKMVFKFEEYQITPLIEEIVLLNQGYAQQFNVKYEIKEKLDNALINVDKDRFIQVITNLLSNAAKFSLPSEVVEIYVKRDHHLIIVSVVNKGRGIPEENHDKLFESFYQSDLSDPKAKKGSGLGLSICKSLVENMGGKIGFKSVIDDKTTFYVRFPEIYVNEYKKSVLVIEDNQTTLLVIKAMFTKLGYNVDTAMSAEEAINMLNSKDYDLLTLDVVLPDKNGLVLLNEIRNDERTDDIPIIIISEHKDALQEVSASENKIIACLEKSFDLEMLKETITEINLKKNQNKVKILHVENDVDILNITRKNLKEIAEIKTATTINEAIGILNNCVFDIIIFDYKLPDGNCDRMIDILKDTINKNARLIVFSAYETSEYLADKVDIVMLKTKTNNEQFCSCIKKFIYTKERANV